MDELKDILFLDRAETGSPLLTDEGFLTVPVYATKAEVFEYTDDLGKKIRMLRPEEEVLAPASVATLGNKPGTDQHPPVANVNANTIGEYVRAATGPTPVVEGGRIKTMVTVFDAALVKKIQNGAKEVSCGYRAAVDRTPGVHPTFGPYDAIQRNIRYNHLALGLESGEGRAGSDVRVLMDSTLIKIPSSGAHMAKVKLGEKNYDLPDDVADAFTKHMDSVATDMQTKDAAMAKYKGDCEAKDAELEKFKKAADSEKKDAKKEVEAKDAKIATLQGTVDELNRQAKEFKDSKLTSKQLAELLKSRLQLVAVAKEFMDSKVNEMLEKEELELMKLTLIASDKDVVLNDSFKADDLAYIRGRFDQLAKTVKPDVDTVLGDLMLKDSAAEKPTGREQKRWTPQPLSNTVRTKA